MRCTARIALSGLGLLLVSGFCGGCTVSQTSSVAAEWPDHAVALAAMGPAVAADTPVEQGMFSLGAGDALGQAIFANYLAYLRSNEPRVEGVYVSGETME